MTFDVYQFEGGSGPVTTVQRHDPAKANAALENPQCVGVIENLTAWSDWDAIAKAQPRFKRLECKLGPRGRQLKEKKGGAS